MLVLAGIVAFAARYCVNLLRCYGVGVSGARKEPGQRLLAVSCVTMRFPGATIDMSLN